MPTITPLQLQKYAGNLGLVSTDTGKIQVGIGSINTPQVPKPAYRQFIAEETSYGQRIGDQVATATTAIANAAIEWEKTRQSAQGMGAAAEDSKVFDDMYWGKDGQFGMDAAQGQAYLDKTSTMLNGYDQAIAARAEELPSYAKSVYLAEINKHKKTLQKTVRTKQSTIENDIIKADLENLERANNSRLIGGLKSVVDSFTPATTPGEREAKLNGWKVDVGTEWLRRSQISGMGQTESDNLAFEVLQTLYAEPGGKEYAQFVEADLIAQITDPEIKAKAQMLYSEAIERDAANYKALNDAFAEKENYMLRENYAEYTRKLSAIDNKADALALVRAAETPEEAKFVSNLISMWYSEEGLTNEAVIFMANNSGMHPRELIAKAQANGIKLNKAAISQSQTMYLSGRKEEIKLFSNTAKNTFASYVQEAGGQFDFEMFPAGSAQKYFVDDMATRFERLALQPENRDKPLDGLLAEFLQTNLNPQLYDHPAFTYSPDKSPYPHGTFKKIEPNTVKNFNDLAEGLIRNAGTYYTNADGSARETRQMNIREAAKRADAGDAAAREIFWKLYDKVQITSAKEVGMSGQLLIGLYQNLPAQRMFYVKNMEKAKAIEPTNSGASTAPPQKSPGILDKAADFIGGGN